MKTKRLKKRMARSAATNSGKECAGCTACCTLMAVPELGKAMYRTCNHVNELGCAVYADRPRSCRTWSCQWRLGAIESDRPDQAGFVVNLGFRGGPHYEVYELREGAASDPRAVAALNKLALPVYVFDHGTNGRWGTRLGGREVFTNNSAYGHGPAGGRISLPVVR